jgi:capsular exopolysaccharide synthesis family protein
MPKLEMNLVDYLRVIRKRTRIIFLSVILVIASTYFYTQRQTPIYRTSCKVKIEQRKSVAEILTEMVTWSPGDAVASQVALIQSYQTMERVAESLGMIDSSMKEEERMRIVRWIQGQITAEPVEATNIIAITITSSNPKQATELVNQVAEVYAEMQFENKKKEATNTRSFVEAQLNNYLKELQESETALLLFRQENPLVIERNITDSHPVLADPRVTGLKEEIVKLELELISLKSKYTDAYPEVVTVKRKLDKSKSDLSDAINLVTNEQKELSSKEVKLAQLKRNVSVAQDLYSMFRRKYEDARILEAEKVQDVTVIERASVPARPISPNYRSNIIVGILSGILIGLIMAFVTESLDTSIGRIDDLEDMLQVPVLGIIPSSSLQKQKKYRFKFKKKEAVSEGDTIYKRLVTLFDPNSVIAEAYKSLRTNLDLTGLKKRGMTIVITSSAPEEGKTQTLCNLGVAMAQAGQKILIIGSDFRKPALHKTFGLKRSPGLAEILLGNLPWQKAVNSATDMLLGGLEYEMILRTPGIENLHVITSGERSPNPTELLSFPEMDTLIQELKTNFDVVLFDSPPTLPVTDSAILGAKVDGVIIVYQAGKTSRHALLRTKIQLENVKVKILGVVINNLKARFIEDVTPYQRYRYYGYYGEKEKR